MNPTQEQIAAGAVAEARLRRATFAMSPKRLKELIDLLHDDFSREENEIVLDACLLALEHMIPPDEFSALCDELYERD